MKILNKFISKLPPARSGKIERKTFRPSSKQSPVRDAVQLTRSTIEGGKTTIDSQTARVTLKNGNSLHSDGQSVQVRSANPFLNDEFEGQLRVDDDKIHIDREGSGQTLGADGSNLLYDGPTGLIVALEDSSATSILPNGLREPLPPDEAPPVIVDQMVLQGPGMSNPFGGLYNFSTQLGPPQSVVPLAWI